MLGEKKQRLQPENHWDWSIPNTQFSQGWKIGNMGFIGGQISADNKAKAVGKALKRRHATSSSYPGCTGEKAV